VGKNAKEKVKAAYSHAIGSRAKNWFEEQEKY